MPAGGHPGFEVARDLFPRYPDPIGREVKIGGRHFKVIGVVEDRGTVMGNNATSSRSRPSRPGKKFSGLVIHSTLGWRRRI